MATVSIGIVGVGNCASSLVQGLVYYAEDRGRAGLTHVVCAGYGVSDVRVTSAFDVDRRKVGRDLAEAIRTAPNNAREFARVPPLGVPVAEGVLADGLGRAASARIDAAAGDVGVDDVAGHLERTGTQVLVSFLPSGSQRASEVYAEAAVRARCAFVNCVPAVIARSTEWARRFEEARLPLVGDDLKSQFGATLVQHALVDALARSGVRLRHTYQIAAGGNMDFLNLQDADRVASKKVTKVQGAGGADLPEGRAHFGAEFIPFLDDRKIAFIRLEGEAFGGTPLEIDLRMCVDDSPSAAGNVLDAVRYAKAALDRGVAGVVDPVSTLLMKATRRPMDEATALAALGPLLGG